MCRRSLTSGPSRFFEVWLEHALSEYEALDLLTASSLGLTLTGSNAWSQELDYVREGQNQTLICGALDQGRLCPK